MSDLVTNIKQRMRIKGWNAYDLEKASGISQTTIHRVLSGQHKDPRTSTIVKIAVGLGTTELELRTKSGYTHKEHLGKTGEEKNHYKINKITRLPLIKWHNIDLLLDAIKKSKDFEVMPTSKITVSNQSFMIAFNSDIYADYIKNGETAIVDPESNPQQGGGVLVMINNCHHIMRYEKIDKEYLHAIRGSKSISMTDQHCYKIIGPVIWIIPAGRKG